MILGVTGTDGAGKGTVVEYLIQKGFTHYSARQLWVNEISRQGLPINRANMRLMANKLRREHGDDFLVREYLRQKEADGVQNAVIESFRAIAEVNTLKAAGGVLIAVDANQQLRYERIQSRASESDRVTFQEFVEHEALEMNDPDPHGMQKAEVMKMADYTILNEGTLEELRARIDAVLKEIRQTKGDQ